MKNFVKINTLLSRIPKVLFEESPEADFVDWMIDGLRLLPNTIQYEERLGFFEFAEGKLQLPKEVKNINSVAWQYKEPTLDAISELYLTNESDPTDIKCIKPITYGIWLNSVLYRDNYIQLKYVGSHSSLVASDSVCRKSTCREEFIVTPSKTMHLTIDNGYLCINYDAPVCDEDNELLIPDVGILHEYLIAYAIYKHWENRQFTKEEQAGNFYQQYLQKQALLFRQAKGDHILRNFNYHTALEIIGGDYKRLIKLPEQLFYVR